MKRKKFFITTTVPETLPFFDGQMKELNKTYEVCAVSSPLKELVPFAEQEGIGYKAIKMERDISLLSDAIALIKWILFLIKERPYVVHANTPKASLLAMLASWLTFRPVRIYMCHGLRYQGCSGLKRKVLIWMERISCFCANHVICVSQGVREQFAEDGICRLEKSTVIMQGSANGVDVDFFDPDLVDESPVVQEYGIKDEKTCLFIGRMVRDKGCEELVDVVCQLHDEGMLIKLLLVGGREDDLDSLSKECEAKINASDFIIECGLQKDVRPFIKASDLLVLPSYREGFGQVLVEANSIGIPVIASRIIGCKNVIKENVNGLLCEPRDRKSLYEVMLRMLTNEDLYTTIKSQCRKYMIDTFDRKKVCQAYVDYYKSFIM